MNHIKKQPVAGLGFQFIPAEFLPIDQDEFYLRDRQFRSRHTYRSLTRNEIRALERQANRCDDWSNLRVADPFDPSLIKNCSFFGRIRIGRLEPYYHEFNNLRMPVGLYNSTIISCDFGDHVVVDNVNFMSHYIVGTDVILANINEMATSDHSKFGNGVVKQGEKESVRIWLEICNENGGRSVLPFNGMKAADAWLWSRFRDDSAFQQRLLDFTDHQFDTRRGYYGKIGDRSVIKNCGIIKDVWIGSDSYIKGANKLKNLTINSEPEASTQIGEGCELVNGIIGAGSRIFYGVKAVRFVLGEQSQLKYGARLINSYLGENSTISCCEVLNSLIFPAHEQHHNNSFLCAATLLGQSNLAAGATVGSNHNSRGADGELIAGRGFWPGLCVSLKHNSRFASFTLIAKGDFPAELDIPLPFSLVHNNVSLNRLEVMPAYWFLHNLYALARNAAKYESRDKRTDRSIGYEYDYLAPDSIQEMIEGLSLIYRFAGMAWHQKGRKKGTEADWEKTGRKLMEENPAALKNVPIAAAGFENSKRPVIILRAADACMAFRRLILYYGTVQLLQLAQQKKCRSWSAMQQALPRVTDRHPWQNIGGQLMPVPAVEKLVHRIRNGSIKSWKDLHAAYVKQAKTYRTQKIQHAYAALLETLRIPPSRMTRSRFHILLQEAKATRQWMLEQIIASRAKDHRNPFRKMMYGNDAEMEAVLGKLEDNQFILREQADTAQFIQEVDRWLEQLR